MAESPVIIPSLRDLIHAQHPDSIQSRIVEALDMFPEVVSRTEELPNDRYTTTPTLTWCKSILKVEAFDLDVAACPEAHHAPRWFGWQANDWEPTPARSTPRTRAGFVDGLDHGWDGRRIWCNPPYDDLEPWVRKAWERMFIACQAAEVGCTPETIAALKPVIGMLIPDNRREQSFWQRLVEPWRDGRWERPDILPHGHLIFDQISVAHDAGARLFTHSLPGRQPFGVPGNPEGVGQASPPFGVVLLEWRFT